MSAVDGGDSVRLISSFLSRVFLLSNRIRIPHRAKTSTDRKRGKKGGKPTTVDPKNGFRKRWIKGPQLKKNAQIGNETR